MKENFLTSMFSEGGKISHKRVITVLISGTLAWGIVYSLAKALNTPERQSILVATMVFVLVMAGVATLPQVLSIIRPSSSTPPEPKQPTTEPQKPTEDEQ